MSANPHVEVRSVLRPEHRVVASIPCRIRTDGLQYHRAEASVVVDRSNGYEEAAVLVVVPGQSSADLRITHLIPVTAGFKHYLNQTPPSPSTSFFHQSSRPHITLSLQHEAQKVELRISSAQTVRVQSLIAELRRLMGIARTNKASALARLLWTQLYPVNPPSLGNLDEDEEVLTPAESSASASAFLSPSSSSYSFQTTQTPLTATTLASDSADEEFPNPFLPTFLRTAFLRKRLFARQDKWSSTTPVRIRLGTYNVNDKLPPPGTKELAPLAGSGEEDILVFSFQEVDLRSQALLVSQGNVRAEEWTAAILAGIGDRAGEFEKLVMTQYVGVVTVVFVKKTLRSAISRVETSERGIGLLGWGGNKAGVAVRMRVHDSTLCFVNSHLAAFASALDRRRSDYSALLKSLTFSRPAGEGILPAYEEFLPENRDKLLSVEDSHVLFWLGDLNYRVEAEDDILRAWVDEQKWGLILDKDQLKSDIASGKSFAGFQEHPIDFPPSYKYIHGSSTLDTKRSPAYTDRILYSVPSQSTTFTPAAKIRCEGYTSHPIFWSDHRPVSAGYTVDVRVIEEEARRAEYVAVERELERLEEVYKPALEVGQTSIEYGAVDVCVPAVREVKLANRGRVPATFSFKSPSQDKPICKPSIWPFPASGVVEAGQEVTLWISLLVHPDSARALTLGEDELNDVLVLHVDTGKDTVSPSPSSNSCVLTVDPPEQFLTIQGNLNPTILGQSLSYLSTLPGPIRSTTLAERKKLAQPKEADPYEGDGADRNRPVKEVWQLLEYLISHGTGIQDLWVEVDPSSEALTPMETPRSEKVFRLDPHSGQEPGLDKGDILSILALLDRGEELADQPPRAVGRTLLILLANVPGRLVGPKAAECENATDRDEAFAALEGLSHANSNVLIGLMSVVTLCAGEPGSPKPVLSPGAASLARAEAGEPDEIDVLDKVAEDTEESTAGAESSEDAQAEREQEQGLSSDPPEVEIDTAAKKDKVSESLDVAVEKMDRLKIMAKKAVGLEDTLTPEAVDTSSAGADSIESSSVILESTVEALVPAVFGDDKDESGHRKRFIRLMLGG